MRLNVNGIEQPLQTQLPDTAKYIHWLPHLKLCRAGFIWLPRKPFRRKQVLPIIGELEFDVRVLVEGSAVLVLIGHGADVMRGGVSP